MFGSGRSHPGRTPHCRGSLPRVRHEAAGRRLARSTWPVRARSFPARVEASSPAHRPGSLQSRETHRIRRARGERSARSDLARRRPPDNGLARAHRWPRSAAVDRNASAAREAMATAGRREMQACRATLQPVPQAPRSGAHERCEPGCVSVMPTFCSRRSGGRVRRQYPPSVANAPIRRRPSARGAELPIRYTLRTRQRFTDRPEQARDESWRETGRTDDITRSQNADFHMALLVYARGSGSSRRSPYQIERRSRLRTPPVPARTSPAHNRRRSHPECERSFRPDVVTHSRRMITGPCCLKARLKAISSAA